MYINLYLATFLYSLINSNSLPLDYIGYFMYTIILSINHGIFGTSFLIFFFEFYLFIFLYSRFLLLIYFIHISFLILIPFISFPCFTTLARISFTKLNTTDVTEIFAVFPSDLKEKACCVSQLSMMFTPFFKVVTLYQSTAIPFYFYFSKNF